MMYLNFAENINLLVFLKCLTVTYDVFKYIKCNKKCRREYSLTVTYDVFK